MSGKAAYGNVLFEVEGVYKYSIRKSVDYLCKCRDDMDALIA